MDDTDPSVLTWISMFALRGRELEDPAMKDLCLELIEILTCGVNTLSPFDDRIRTLEIELPQD